MSFSVTVIGKADAIKRKLAETSEQLTGESKTEFDAVKPALETILDQNVNTRGAENVLRLDANGHASFDGETKTYGQCAVSVSVLGQIAE